MGRGVDPGANQVSTSAVGAAVGHSWQASHFNSGAIPWRM